LETVFFLLHSPPCDAFGDVSICGPGRASESDNTGCKARINCFCHLHALLVVLRDWIGRYLARKELGKCSDCDSDDNGGYDEGDLRGWFRERKGKEIGM
jgi:hypothetical protein